MLHHSYDRFFPDRLLNGFVGLGLFSSENNLTLHSLYPLYLLLELYSFPLNTQEVINSLMSFDCRTMRVYEGDWMSHAKLFAT